MSPAIVELDANDIPEVCELFQKVFGHAISPELWRWKYTQGPRLGSINLVARAATGQLLGHVGASIFPGTVQRAALSMAQVCDVMVRSSARGGLAASDVYPRLIKTLQGTLAARFVSPYAYGFAGVRPYKLGSRLGFYRELQQCRPGYFVQSGAADWGRALWRAREIEWNFPRLDRIWARYKAQLTRPTVSRTGAYLGWRYLTHPTNSYRLWLLTHLSRDRGLFITRTMPNGEICIIDALIPDFVNPSRLIAALDVALTTSATESPPIFAWFLPPGHNQLVEPVIGSEVRVNHWHTRYPNPRFQPGDTDVY